MLRAKRSAVCTAASVRDARSRQASISGGSSESEVTAFAVAPAGPLGPGALTTVTPVGSRDIASRKLSGSGAGIIRLKVEKYDAARVRPLVVITATAAAALLLGACGSEGISVPEDDPNHEGAVLFAERCSGCHTLHAAGAQGSANRAVRNQGPNLDQRTETVEDVLFAIRNGGFSGAIMPQNIVVGDQAQAVAEFVAEYAGSEVDRPPAPGDASE
jgi:mono/diheme cytochrome c family protein